MFKYNAKVIRVVDGDTVDALVDLGFSTFKKVRIRMMGINAPESRTRDMEEKAKGLAAKIRLEELLEEEKFILESHGVGKFGRCLGTLHVDDVNVNKTLVEEGHAWEYYGGKR
jgi:micrococcal nuclease|tara:strand:+ start:1396 stop:1734 length:339 start_codon:yes stop_codon:yes gene_type:complete